MVHFSILLLVLVNSYRTKLTQGIHLAASQLLLLCQTFLLSLLVLIQPFLILCSWPPEERVTSAQMHVPCRNGIVEKEMVLILVITFFIHNDHERAANTEEAGAHEDRTRNHQHEDVVGVGDL